MERHGIDERAAFGAHARSRPLGPRAGGSSTWRSVVNEGHSSPAQAGGLGGSQRHSLRPRAERGGPGSRRTARVAVAQRPATAGEQTPSECQQGSASPGASARSRRPSDRLGRGARAGSRRPRRAAPPAAVPRARRPRAGSCTRADQRRRPRPSVRSCSRRSGSAAAALARRGRRRSRTRAARHRRDRARTRTRLTAHAAGRARRAQSGEPANAAIWARMSSSARGSSSRPCAAPSARTCSGSGRLKAGEVEPLEQLVTSEPRMRASSSGGSSVAADLLGAGRSARAPGRRRTRGSPSTRVRSDRYGQRA